MSSSETVLGKRRFSEGLTGYHFLVLAVACFGWSFDTMDQWLYVFVKQHALRELLGPVLVPLTGDLFEKLRAAPEFLASALAQAVPGALVPRKEIWDVLGTNYANADILNYTGYVQSALMIGWATGGLLFGIIGDFLGRTRTMAITILMYAGFTGLSGLAQTWEQFALLRFLTGMGVGGEFAAGAALVAETFPDHSRATALSIVQATSALGNITACLLNLGMAKFFDPAHAWRWLFTVGIVPALLVFVIFLFIREPQRWRDVREEIRLGKRSNLKILLELFTNPTIRRNTLVGIGIGAVGVVGFWGISTWTPEFLRSILNPRNLPELKGIVESKVSYAGMAQNLGSFFGALFFAILANRIGRRPAFAVALLACFIEIPITFFFTNSFPLALIFFFGMGFVLLFLLGGFSVYFPELFPTRLRATGTGICYNVARYVSAPSPSFFGTWSKTYGIQNAAMMISGIFILGLAILPFAPETKDKPLPE